MKFERMKHWLTPERRKKLGWIWLLGSVLYDAARSYVVSRALSSHGINGVYYFIFSVVVAVPFSLVSIRLVWALVDKNILRINIFLLLTAVTFFAPDFYVFIVGHDLSAKIIIIYACILACTTTVTAISILRQVRQKKSETREVGVHK